MFAATVEEFDAHVSKWQAHQNSASLYSHSKDYLTHPSYDKLVNLGSPIVPLMEEYAHDQGGWWHELLYQITQGHRFNNGIFNEAELCQK